MWSPSRVFRLLFRFQCNDYFTVITEAGGHVENNKMSSREDTDIFERDIPGSGNNGRTPSHLTSPITLLTPGEDQVILPQSTFIFRRPSPTQQGNPVRFEVMDSRGQLLQWSALTNITLGFDHRIRCIQTRMGTSCQGTSTGGPWTATELVEHINYMKMKAAFLALQSSCTVRSSVSVLLLMDNVTAIAFLGGNHSHPLSGLAKEVWIRCIKGKVTIHTEHLPGSENIRVD